MNQTPLQYKGVDSYILFNHLNPVWVVEHFKQLRNKKKEIEIQLYK